MALTFYVKDAGLGGIDEYTKLMMHMDGENDGTVFVDSSYEENVISPNGDAATKTDIKKFGSASGYFDGTDDYLTIPDSVDWNFGTGNFTIDFWIYNTNIPSAWQTFIGQYDDTAGCFALYTGNGIATPKVSFALWYSSWADYKLVQSDTYNMNEWTHIAVIREDTTTFKLYINGVLSDTESVPADLVVDNNIASGLRIGHQQTGPAGYGFIGYSDEFRISKGIARWTTDFDVPEGPYTT